MERYLRCNREKKKKKVPGLVETHDAAKGGDGLKGPQHCAVHVLVEGVLGHLGECAQEPAPSGQEHGTDLEEEFPLRVLRHVDLLEHHGRVAPRARGREREDREDVGREAVDNGDEAV